MDTALDLVAMPWAFTQVGPMTTNELISEAIRRGLRLDAAWLRALYRSGDLVPMLEVTSRRVHEPLQVSPGLRRWSSSVGTLRIAMSKGRLRDPAIEPYRPWIRFDTRRITDPSGWRNGLFYSRWQLLSIPRLRDRMNLGHEHQPTPRRRMLSPQLPEQTAMADGERQWSLVLSALDARYYPVVDRGYLRLSNADRHEWEDFSASFNPVAVAEQLSLNGDDVRNQAEHLLARARAIDPLGAWSDLVRRAPTKARDALRGDALVACENKLAAEILLLFYEDLARHEVVPTIQDLPTAAREVNTERLSGGRDKPLDEVLVTLGVSPHPGVVLIVEGETEEVLVPRVFDHLRLGRTPDQVQILCMRGADKELALVAAATATPLLGPRRGEAYDLIRPPTRLVVAVDQDDKWDTAAKVEKERQKMLSAIRKVVLAQGALVADDELDRFVQVRTWPARCFEFAHFTPSELTSALRSIHDTCGGLQPRELEDRIADVQSRGLDIKKVWDRSWSREPSKRVLADALWPTLRDKIDDARWDADLAIPPVAEVVYETHGLAGESKLGRFSLKAELDS